MAKKKPQRKRRTAAERAEDKVMDFTRKKMREDRFYRRILPPLTITNEELDRRQQFRVIEPGHIYALANKLGGEQILTFFKDLPHGDPTNHDGVLCQDVLRALIDRVNELQAQKPCHETVDILIKLREVLVLFEVRAARGTLEKSYAKVGLYVEELPVHPNGHIFDLAKPGTGHETDQG